MERIRNKVGLRYGRWLVVEKGARVKNKQYWVCRCDCGTERSVMSDILTIGDSRSCGCLKRERTTERNTTHGLSSHPLHAIWRGMNARCTNPNVKSFADYGARGIAVCDRWHSFPNFYADMLPTWRPGLTIERKDNDLGYDPRNCIWLPKARQSKNRRTVRLLETPWGKLTTPDAARRIGITRKGLVRRMQSGRPPETWFMPRQT